MPSDKPDGLAALPPLMLGGSLWAIRPDALPRVLDTALHMASAGPRAALMEERPAAPEQGVAVIPLTGVLTPHGSILDLLFGGGGGVQSFRDRLSRAVADPSVAAIVLDVDSPGGSVGLVPETAADVRAARDVKPVVAVANTQAASGAYWIASQASELFASPSALVGSIGVYYVHEDWSRFNDRMGIDVSYIYAGKYKTEGNPDEPLSAEAREAWQADADKLYQGFLETVADGRGTTAEAVRDGYGEGRVLLSDAALEAGMVDGIETLADSPGRRPGRGRRGRGRLRAAPRAGRLAGARAARRGAGARSPGARAAGGAVRTRRAGARRRRPGRTRRPGSRAGRGPAAGTRPAGAHPGPRAGARPGTRRCGACRVRRRHVGLT